MFTFGLVKKLPLFPFDVPPDQLTQGPYHQGPFCFIMHK